MHELTPEGHQLIKDVAQRHGVSVDAAVTMIDALVAGQRDEGRYYASWDGRRSGVLRINKASSFGISTS